MPTIFRTTEHEYFVDKKKVPGVNEIFASVGVQDTRWFKDEHKKRGTDIHAMTVFDDKNIEIDPETVESSYKPYIAAYRLFKSVAVYSPLEAEKVCFSGGSVPWCGQFDRLATINDEIVLLDIKTGSRIYPHVKYQLIAYYLALPDDLPKPNRLAVLLLKNNGKFKLEYFDITQDLIDEWMAIVNVYYIRLKLKANFMLNPIYSECENEDEESKVLYKDYIDISMSLEIGDKDKKRKKETVTKIKKKDENSQKESIEEIVDYLNQKTGSRYRAKTDATKSHINARLREGFTVDDFKAVIDNKCKDWKGTEFEKFLRPSTLFSKSKFEEYLNQRIKDAGKESSEKRTPKTNIDFCACLGGD